MVFGFGPYELDLATCELRHKGLLVPLQPRVFSLLRYLIQHRDRVVGKQELIEALWGGYSLNAVAVPWTINRVRKALGHEGVEQNFIETVRGHGYRFIGELRVAGDEAGSPSSVRIVSSSETPSADAPPNEPRRSFVSPPFVGREAVVQRLATAIDAAGTGRGRLFFLTGETGIGKTRCADEFSALARRRGLQVWVGRCFDQGVAPAFWPFVQIVRAACSDPSLQDAVRNEGTLLLKELEPRDTDVSRVPAQGTAGDDRFWLFDRLSRWLCRTAKSQVRVIEFEDLHCADESSLKALSLLSPLLLYSRIVVLATARDLNLAPAGRSVTALAARLRPCEHVPLTGLHLADVQTYLRATLGDELAAELSSTLSAKTAGNPLFLNEVTKVIGAQYEREGSVRAEDVRLPAAVTEILSARFLELEPTTRLVLDAACVIGERFSVSVLQRITRLANDAVLRGLQAAAHLAIVEPQTDGSMYGFVHPLMREVLYAALPNVERAKLHAEVGLALEAMGVSDSALSSLAYHFHQALEPHYERAARYARLAGEATKHTLAYDEAAQFYAWALEAQAQAAPNDVQAICNLLLCSASALSLASRWEEARQQCQRAIELARTAKLPAVLVLAARQLRPSTWFSLVPDALTVKALEDALIMLPEDDVDMRARAYAQLAGLRPYSLRRETCEEMSHEAVRLANISKDPSVRLEAQCSRLIALSGPGTIDEQLEVADAVLRLDPEQAWSWCADAHFARYHALLQRGDGAAAERALNAFTRFASDLRLRRVSWHCERLRAQHLLYAGRLDEAERRFGELYQQSLQLGVPIAPMCYRAQTHALNFERTGKRLSVALSDPPPAATATWTQSLASMRTHRLLLMIESGEIASATHEFRALTADGFSTVADNTFGLIALVRLATAACQLSQTEAAPALRSALEPFANLIALSPISIAQGCVSRNLGDLESLLGRRNEARAYYENAITVNERAGLPLERLRSMLGLAECLALSRAHKDRVQGRKLAAEIGEAAEGVGAGALATTARALEASLRSDKIRTLAPPVATKSSRRSARPARSPRTRA